jgi:hypothetical protein
MMIASKAKGWDKPVLDQGALLDFVTEQVYERLESPRTRENGAFTVNIPWGLNTENKLKVADWLQVNFPLRVQCVKDRQFITLTAEQLHAANVYRVDLK